MTENMVTIVRGKAALTLPESTKEHLATEISYFLDNARHMRPRTPEQLRRSIDDGRFVVVLGANKIACTEIRSFPREATMECGAWASFIPQEPILHRPSTRIDQGMGSLAMVEGARLARTFPETESVVALVREDNKQAQTAMERIGGIAIDKQSTPDVTKIIYDISQIE